MSPFDPAAPHTALATDRRPWDRPALCEVLAWRVRERRPWAEVVANERRLLREREGGHVRER